MRPPTSAEQMEAAPQMKERDHVKHGKEAVRRGCSLGSPLPTSSDMSLPGPRKSHLTNPAGTAFNPI